MKRITNYFLKLCLPILLFAGSICAYAVSDSKPTIRKFKYTDGASVDYMSDNGEWVIAYPAGVASSGGHTRLLNLKTNESVQLVSGTTGGHFSAADVTNDGGLVVGSYNGKPAYWTKESGTWTTLTTTKTYISGQLSNVTPDGRYAVGTLDTGTDGITCCGVLFDLTTGKEISLNNLPTKDMQHETLRQMRFSQISADGRYILAFMSFSYIYPPNLCAFVYDRTTEKATFIGFTPDDTQSWTPADENLYFIDFSYMSNNGKWVTGYAYTTADNYVGYKYNVETGEFTLFNESSDTDRPGFAVSNDGMVIGASPTSTPLRNFYVRHGSYWYDIDMILEQRYGIDYYATTNYEYTGFPTAISDDGKTLIVTTDPNENETYAITFPDSLENVCNSINLLGNYSVSPKEGTAFAKEKSFKITFTRNIELAGSYQNVTFEDADGNVLKYALNGTGGVSVNGNVLTLNFRPVELEAGKQYYLRIAKNTVTVKGDARIGNDEIKIGYMGRDNVSVQQTKIYPADSSEVTSIDNSSTPVIITFDTDIAKTESASACLFNVTTNDTVCNLNMYCADSVLYVYPTAKQYLYQGSEYKVIVKKGSVADVQGYGGNDEIAVGYTGVYERVLPTDDATLFADDFSSMSQSLATWMRWEGDHNTPNTEMRNWEFDADNQPWNFSIRESSSSTDICAASTSMYSPAGKSDDWMVIPQITVPDEYCTLSFKAQSYKNSKKDSLKVLVWANTETINTLTDNVVNRMKREGKVVFNEQLTPGASEDGLDGEWTDYAVDLGQFNGKSIYIAFVNENEDQSCVFVDDVKVVRNLKYLLSLTNASSVVDKVNIDITGTLTVNSDVDTYSSVTLTLFDANGEQVGDAIGQSGLSLKKGDKFPFAFSTPLPLNPSSVNKFSIRTQLDDYTDTRNATIKNLSFKPTKNVVLEEYTGTDCPNCPFGIVAIENLRKMFGDNIIPISIHTYSGGDAIGSDMSSYSTALGLNAAPTGIVNRDGEITNPIWQNPVTLDYQFNDQKNGACWLDHVNSEMATPADAEVSVSVDINETAGTFSLPIQVRYAMNANNLNLNLFAVVLEDSVISYQLNNRYNEEQEILGEWGKGGMYAFPTNTNVCHDDVARACLSTSINGYSGYLPQSMTANETYSISFDNITMPKNILDTRHAKAVVMLLDATTGKVVNAAMAKFYPVATAIKDVNSDNSLSVEGGYGHIVVRSESTAAIECFAVSGTLIASCKGSGTVSLPTNGYKGVAVVRVATTDGTTVRKIIVR